MLRTTWKADFSLFLQADDTGMLVVRAADGFEKSHAGLAFEGKSGPLALCFGGNKVVEADLTTTGNGLAALFAQRDMTQKLVLVPVLGQAKVLGVLALGPFKNTSEIMAREAELRSAGALCAVLSAHWRLYEWMSQYVTQVNHELRTPLTAVQGSLGMVLGGVFGQVGGEVRAMLEMAQNGCERTVRAIEGYLNKQEFPKDEPKK